MKERTRNIMWTLVSVAVVCVVPVWYAITHIADFAVLKNVSLSGTALIAGLYIVFVWLNSLLLLVTLRPFRAEVTMTESVAMTVLTYAGNAFLPLRGGAALRAAYLKTAHRLPYSHFVAVLAVATLIGFIAAAVTGVASLVLIKHHTWDYPATLGLAGFLSLCICSVISLCLPVRLIRGIAWQWLRNRLAIVADGVERLRGSVYVVVMVFILSLAIILCMSLITYCECRVLRITGTDKLEIGYLQAIFYGTSTSLAMILSITPSGLGLRESLAMLVAGMVRMTPSMAIAVSVYDRVVSCAVYCALMPLAIRYLHRIRNGRTTTEEQTKGDTR